MLKNFIPKCLSYTIYACANGNNKNILFGKTMLKADIHLLPDIEQFSAVENEINAHRSVPFLAEVKACNFSTSCRSGNDVCQQL